MQDATTHILIAASDEVEASLDAAASGSTIRWKVPKKAQVGDPCLLSHQGIGLYARGEVMSPPAKTPDERGAYVSEIGNVVTLGEVVDHALLAAEFPEWGWPTYPRSKTTVPLDVEGPLWDVIVEFEAERPPEIDESVSNEGGAQIRMHTLRERDSGLANRKKQAVLAATGTLRCEICAFDFERRYGELGKGFCEVHHLRPLSHRERSEPTVLQELAVLCSNCHRMIHRQGLLAIADLASRVRDVT